MLLYRSDSRTFEFFCSFFYWAPLHSPAASPVPTPLPTLTRLDDGERHGVVPNQIVADLASTPPPPLRQDEQATAQISEQVR